MELPPEAREHSRRLSDFILQEQETILGEWREAVRQIPGASSLSEWRLLNTMPELLHAIAAAVETAYTGGEINLQELPDVHALERLDEGFNLCALATEYSMLRQCILDLYGRKEGDVIPLTEVQRLDQAIDQAVVVSVTRYLHARERTLMAMERIFEAGLGSQDAEAFLPRLLQVLMETIEAVDSVVVLLREDDMLRVRAAVGLDQPSISGLQIPMGHGFSGLIAVERRPRFVRCAATDPVVLTEGLWATGTRALYGVPLLHEGQVIGVIHMGSRTAYDFSGEDRSLLRMMAGRTTALVVQAALMASERAAGSRVEELLARVDALFAAAPVGMAFLDPQLRYVRVNGAMAAMDGLPEAAHVGRPLREVLPGGVEALEPRLRRILDTGEPLRDFELVVSPRDADGPRTWLASFFPVRMQDGWVLGVGGVVLDITARRRAEEARREEAELRERFIAVLGHDLRDPLQAITLQTSVLLRHGGLGGSQMRALARIHASGERISRMVSQLLDFTRVRSGVGMGMTPRPTNLTSLCEQVLAELELAHPGHPLRFASRHDAWADCDPDRIAQVFSNLVSNAVTHGARDVPVEITLQEEGNEVVLRVTNQGPPIPPDLLPHLFDPFQRGTRAGMARDGLGLGLYIVREIVRAHGGSVDVRSTEAEGTTFTVRLPRQRRET